MKAVRIFTGLLLLVIGGILALPGVPGPGILILLLGLVLLSRHFVWAERSVHYLKRKLPHAIGGEGK